ncbi:hypothetical protein PP753_gp03 [Dinoroseobacter phage vB_DshP-R7L]|uniref:Uncharacterized protein n=1 Tax=Dinoroseobacter phage vB_DshP-R7L TaxID=2873349 RepID=A0AAE8XD29_9CAUD|nr:hypothetical protein PP753_gp03 [Dinoroseobacter phage vB_DshP-R7L]UAT28842.1 hypothetical protein R7L_gp3 [Dinoroseobacter phage vB_DshP-R7L]
MFPRVGLDQEGVAAKLLPSFLGFRVSLVVSVVASQTVPHTNNPDQRAVSPVDKKCTYRLRSMIAKEDSVQAYRDVTVQAIKINAKKLKDVQHSIIHSSFLGPVSS